MTDPSPLAEMDKVLQRHGRLLTANGKNQRRLEAKVDDLITRVDGFGLNGSGPAIRRLADAADKLVELAERAPYLIEIAGERSDAAATWRTIRRWTRWGRGTQAILATLMAAVTGTATYEIATHLFGATGGH